jgi:hypothetical protein
LTNISDFSKVGLSSLKDSSAFKKVQYHSKPPSSQLFDSSTIGYSKFDVLNKLYSSSSVLGNSEDYYTDRQNNYTLLLASQLSSDPNLKTELVNNKYSMLMSEIYTIKDLLLSNKNSSLSFYTLFSELNNNQAS